jgi:hypothetical protein
MSEPEPINYLILASLERRIEELKNLAERMAVCLINYPAAYSLADGLKWREAALSLALEAEIQCKKGPPYHVTHHPPTTPRDDTRPADDPFGGDLTPGRRLNFVEQSRDSHPCFGLSLPTTPIPEGTQDHPAGTDMAGHLPLAQDALPSDGAPGPDVGC